MSSLRERLADAVKINDYLRKQIEIYHITHNNTESLLEMAQRLNLTKDELEVYKEKLAKIEDLNQSMMINPNSAQLNNNSNNLNVHQFNSGSPARQGGSSRERASLPSSPSKTTPTRVNGGGGSQFAIASLENELNSWKLKHQNLKVPLKLMF